MVTATAVDTHVLRLCEVTVTAVDTHVLRLCDRLRFTGPNVRQGVADHTGDNADREPGQHIPCDVPRWTENDDAHDYQKPGGRAAIGENRPAAVAGATTTATFG